MEATPSTCFLGRIFAGGSQKCCSQVSAGLYPRYPVRLLLASCKMRQRNLSWQNKQHSKKIKLERPTNTSVRRSNGDSDSNSKKPLTDSILGSDQDNTSNNRDQENSKSNDLIPVAVEIEYSNPTNAVTDSAEESSHSDDENMSVIPSRGIALLSTHINGGEQFPGGHIQELIGMIRNAERNIHLLNEARVHALQDLDKILSEKAALQGELNLLEMKLAETDARLKVAAEEKIHVKLLEDQLEKLQNEMDCRSISEKYTQESSNLVSSSQIGHVNSVNEELRLLRAENMSLKDELLVLKAELIHVKETDQRVQMLEEERSSLQSSLKQLELKLAASQEDVSKISSLKSEYRDLCEKVEDLQTLLDKATEQADEAILVLQQNQELRKKVDQLEESLSEANDYRLSLENMQLHNELMQQKMKLLDEHLQKSDEEIHSYVESYQDSMKEFQDTLNNLKQESKKKEQDESVIEKPLQFWSMLLLMVDGWFLENKISEDKMKLLREMIWNREERICNAYMSSKQKNEHEMIATFLKLTSPTMSEKLHVIHIAAEMAPVAKVGGLGDVVTGLSRALQKKGHLVEIILPKYDCMHYELIRELKALDVPVESYFDGRLFKNKIWVGTVEGLPVYFIEPQHPDKFFWRGQHYGEQDDFKRFSFFSRAALELLLRAGKKPDIIHCHDWQTAFVAPLYWDLYVPKGLNSARICFTCHNFEYQGSAPASELASCGLDVHHLNRPDRMQDNSAHGRVNPVKGAVVFSNIVTTVSPSYAQEVRNAEGGRGMHTTINLHSKKFVGILNGIDTDVWNPATDRYLKYHYSSNDIEGKAENKDALRRHLGLSSTNIRQPLVACITRLVPQKGVHLIRHALYRTLELGGQFILLGSSPVSQIQREFEDISNHFKTREDARLILKYDESLSHWIYAASDMLIIPSIFEPCGLTQMIAMRYGSIPVARKTGGLNDSVFDLDDEAIPLQYRNGFTFLTADEQGFNNALERAFYHYKNDGEGWEQLIQKVMNIDFSWETSASEYEELYQMTVSRARSKSHT